MTASPLPTGLTVSRPEDITWEKSVLKIVDKNPAISTVDPPSRELIDQLNRIASQPPFCYLYKAKPFDSR